MYRNDCLQPESSFHPELLALNEKKNVMEILLDIPALKYDQGVQKVLYTTDYPIICYLGKVTENEEAQQLIMMNLADTKHPTKKFELRENEMFVSFVDST